MQIFLNILNMLDYVEDKNRRHRWVDACSKREREGPEIVASSLSASSLLFFLSLSFSSLLPRQPVDFHATTIRGAFRCAAIIMYCERKLSLWDNRLSNGRRSHNKRKVWRESSDGYLTRVAW